MKNKTKIMMGLAALTAGTLAAGATGTLAWFTTNKTATATYSNITAQGTQGNLSITMKALVGEATLAEQTDKGTASATSSAKISDVSSNNGLAFYQPQWVSKQGNNAEVYSVKDVTNESGYYVQYLITITNAATSNDANTDIKVYLSELAITASSGSGAELAGWTRVAIISANGLSADSSSITTGSGTIYQNDVSDANCKYAIDTATQDGKTLLNTQDLTTKPTQAGTYTSNTGLEISSSLATGGSVTIGVSVWMEGTMADQDAAKGESVDIKLAFSTQS